jgi:hypothetical protein
MELFRKANQLACTPSPALSPSIMDVMYSPVENQSIRDRTQPRNPWTHHEITRKSRQKKETPIALGYQACCSWRSSLAGDLGINVSGLDGKVETK